jgi:hypothetical protein
MTHQIFFKGWALTLLGAMALTVRGAGGSSGDGGGLAGGGSRGGGTEVPLLQKSKPDHHQFDNYRAQGH